MYAWQGDYAAALTALDGQVTRGSGDPIARYAPFEAIRRRLAGEPPADPWADLLAVYGQWLARYPRSCQSYAAAATVYARRLGDNDRPHAPCWSAASARVHGPPGCLRIISPSCPATDPFSEEVIGKS